MASVPPQVQNATLQGDGPDLAGLISHSVWSRILLYATCTDMWSVLSKDKSHSGSTMGGGLQKHHKHKSNSRDDDYHSLYNGLCKVLSLQLGYKM